MSWKLGQLAQWCGAVISREQEDVVISAVSFDSRKVVPGTLFVALRGGNADGHNYVFDAVKNGAAAVMVEHSVDVSVPQLLVESTHKAFGLLAAGYRRSTKVKVVGITGSVGKTSTKEMIASILEAKYSTAKSEGNHNNDLGLPMSILDMPEQTQMAVLEMGMNHFGEMAYLTKIAAPDIAVITNIGTVHIEHLGSREGILQAKLEILQGMSADGTVVLNGDEQLLWNLSQQKEHKKYYYGIENSACDIVAENVHPMDGGMGFQVRGLGHCFEVFIPAEGIHTVYNALAAITVGLLCGIREEKIQSQLSAFQNTGMRQQILTENGMTIINDCYNAGPESMEAALNVLGDRPCEGRRIAVLGDMLELGTRSMAEHYRIGRIAAAKADLVYVFGTYSARIVDGAATGGMPPADRLHFPSHESLAQKLRAVAKPGDVLLFKGSRGMRMENVLKLFLEKE